jgi:hypothetical protein
MGNRERTKIGVARVTLPIIEIRLRERDLLTIPKTIFRLPHRFTRERF